MLDPQLSGRVGYTITGLRNYYPVSLTRGLRDTRRHLLVGNCETSKATGPGTGVPAPASSAGNGTRPCAARRRSFGSPAALRLSDRSRGRERGCAATMRSSVTGHERSSSSSTRGGAPPSTSARSAGRASGSRQGASPSPQRWPATSTGTVAATSSSGAGRGSTAYVVFGKTSTTTLASARLGAAGLTIRGERGTRFPSAAAGAGDVNGDGLADVLLGAPEALPLGDGYFGGSVYLVYGRTSGGAVDLAATGSCIHADRRHSAHAQIRRGNRRVGGVDCRPGRRSPARARDRGRVRRRRPRAPQYAIAALGKGGRPLGRPPFHLTRATSARRRRPGRPSSGCCRSLP